MHESPRLIPVLALPDNFFKITLENDSVSVIINSMQDEPRYTIDELSALTGFSRRTIRFYVEKGLIAPPAGRGRGGYYSSAQLKTLERILEAKQEGRSLASIARHISLSSDVPPASESSSPSISEAVPGAEPFCRQPERILRWTVAPGLHIEATEHAARNDHELLAALFRVAGMGKEEPNE